MLLLRLVDGGRDHRIYMEPCFLIIFRYPTSWAYTCNNHINTQNNHPTRTELVGSAKLPSQGFLNTSSEKQTSQYVYFTPYVVVRRVILHFMHSGATVTLFDLVGLKDVVFDAHCC